LSSTRTTQKSGVFPSSPPSKVSAPSPPAPAITVPTIEPAFIADNTLKTDTNPAGLVSCAIRVWQYAHGQWFPITGVARWEEFAPLKTVWIDNQPTDRKVLDKSGRLGDMLFLMLGKCAEAQAIRKNWPEDLSNTFETPDGTHPRFCRIQVCSAACCISSSATQTSLPECSFLFTGSPSS
jgi:hypothetical protein